MGFGYIAIKKGIILVGLVGVFDYGCLNSVSSSFLAVSFIFFLACKILEEYYCVSVLVLVLCCWVMKYILFFVHVSSLLIICLNSFSGL